MKKIVIIILNWNGWRDTIECLESIYQINYPNYEVIVVDNNSENDSIKRIEEYCRGKIVVESNFFKYCYRNKPINVVEILEDDIKTKNINSINTKLSHSDKKLTIIKNKKNYGFAKGNNIGINYSLRILNTDYVLLLNNDTVVENNFLTELLTIAELNEDFGIFSPLIYEYYDPNKIQYTADEIKWYSGRMKRRSSNVTSNLLESDTICGASMFIKKETINTIGLLSEDYFMLYEDLDYSINAKLKGIKCGYISTSKIWHKGSVSIGKFSNPLRIRCSIRNRIIFWKKYSKNKIQFTFFLISIILNYSPLLLIGILRSNNKKKLFKSFFKGLLEGIQY